MSASNMGCADISTADLQPRREWQVPQATALVSGTSMQAACDVVEMVLGVVQGVLEQAPDIASRLTNGQPSSPGRDARIVGEFREPDSSRRQLPDHLVGVGIAVGAGGLVGDVVADRWEGRLGAGESLLDTVGVQRCHVSAVGGVLDRRPRPGCRSCAEANVGRHQLETPALAQRPQGLKQVHVGVRGAVEAARITLLVNPRHASSLLRRPLAPIRISRPNISMRRVLDRGVDGAPEPGDNRGPATCTSPEHDRWSAHPDRRITSAQERGGLGAATSYLSLPSAPSRWSRNAPDRLGRRGAGLSPNPREYGPGESPQCAVISSAEWRGALEQGSCVMDMSPTQGPDMGDPQAAGGSANGVAVDDWRRRRAGRLERLGAVACSGATRRIELRPPAGTSTGTVEGAHMGRVG